MQTSQQKAGWDDFLVQEAAAVASQLSDLVAASSELSSDLSLRDLFTHDTLSPFLQHLAHTMRVSGAQQAAANIEDILRNSLIYQQGSTHDDGLGTRLVNLCRNYLRLVSDKPGHVTLADGTGFSTFTVEALRARAADDPRIADTSSWEPSQLFSPNSPGIVRRVEMLAATPELTLGEVGGRFFNPVRVANILADWVRGETIPTLVKRHVGVDASPADTAKFTTYLYSTLTHNASWGLGALQRIAWAGTDVSDTGDSANVPSMVYYGVGSQPAVWMRMVRLPREAAGVAARAWEATGRQQPSSYAKLRSFVDNMTAQEWTDHRASRTVSGEQMRLLWRELN